MCTLIKLDGKKAKKGDILQKLYVVPVNPKLPWAALDKIPKEVQEEIKADKGVSQKYYIGKYKEWTRYQKKPIFEVISCIGEAGNIDAESMRILKTHEICTEAYSDNMECLKPFMQNINP